MSNKDKNPIFTVFCFGIIAIVSFIGVVEGISRIGFDYIVKNNMLTSSSAYLWQYFGLFVQ